MPPSFSNVNSRFPAKITEITHVIDVIQANQKREMRTGDKSRSGREAGGGGVQGERGGGCKYRKKYILYRNIL